MACGAVYRRLQLLRVPPLPDPIFWKGCSHMQKNYKIQTTYTQESIRAVAKMTCDVFLPHVSGRMYLLSFILIIIGVAGLVMRRPIFAVILIFGCYMLLKAEDTSRAFAKQMLAQYNGKFPALKFDFRENDVFVATPKESGAVQYDMFVRLAENEEYFFLFNSDRSAYTIKKTDLTGDREREFKNFLEDKTGLTFEQGATFVKKILAAQHYAANKRKDRKA